MQWFFPFLIFLFGFLAMYLLIRKDTNKNNSLTKKGFIKLIVSMVVVFVLVTTFVVLSNN
ncbi:DUF3976 domain-containing protein [Peribacillus sp. NPDC096447]|uniref:DUF3976 domain-containing protein n=1 Tax=Peribacillus sp. NPDC096447 TaxID=3364394 RepID=UPI003813F5E6